MILDKQLEFGSAQAVTAAAASTNVIDLGAVREIGVGEDLYIVLQVTETMADSGSDSTLTVDLQTDDNESFSSAAVISTLITLAALTPAGRTHYFKVPTGTLNAWERYARIYYTPNNGNLSAGKFSAFITKDIQAYRSYAAGFTIS